MRYKYITKYSWIILFFCVFEQISAQNLNGALINSCGTEGANEFLFFKNGGTDLTVSPSNIDVRYGTSTAPGTSGNLTNNIGAPVSGSFVSDLNALLPNSGCAISFAYAPLGSTIPANSNFILMNDDANNVINYSGWCNSGLSTTIYIIFSSSSNWASSGQFANTAATPKERYIVTTFNSGSPTVYSYYADETNGDTGGWNTTTSGDGAYAYWNGPGAATVYSKYSSCTPPNPATLPIKLAGFNAELTHTAKVKLSWETTSEINFSHFEVQRSADALGFETIGRVESKKSENSNTNYEFIDSNPLSKTGYYRLKEVDIDGSSSLSKIVSIIPDIENQELIVFPNPTSDYFEIKGLKYKDIQQIKVFNQAGLNLLNIFNFEKQFNITSIEPQLLLVEIIEKNGKRHFQRILKR
jgi:hypothetical protein